MKVTIIDVETLYKDDPKLKREDVQKLQEWLEKQPHLPKVTELQITLFLHSCYYSNEAAKIALDAYFTVRTLCPDLFAHRNLSNPTLARNARTSLRGILPEKTHENYVVLYSRLMDTNVDYYNINDEFLLCDMTSSLNLHKTGPSEGVLLILDMAGSTFGHLTKISIIVLKKWLYYVQEAMPIRLKGIHFINAASFLDKLLMMMKPFLKKEIYETIHVHSDSLETLYQFIPKKILPKDIGGGSSETFASLHEKNLEDLEDNTEFFIAEEKQMVDESKRPGKPKSAGALFGIEGTFKKLEVD